MKLRKPRILLIGAGAFGVRHLETLLTLERKGILTISGVVVKTKKSQQRLQKKYSVPVHINLSDTLLEKADAIDIVTPVETHASLIEKFLPKAHVLVEKPLATTTEEAVAIRKQAARSKKVLMVGHIFRFHPVVMRLRQLLQESNLRPVLVEGVFVNPAASDKGRDVELEMLHLFDIVDYLFGKELLRKHIDDKGRLKIISAIYQGGLRAVFKMGWAGMEKKRKLKLIFKHHDIVCDLEENFISVYKNGLRQRHIDCTEEIRPLERELRTFVRAIQGHEREYPNAAVGERMVRFATAGRSSASSRKRKRVAVIGGGIFGTNCAIELAPFCDVTVFEKNNSILSEASFINQYRHHWGYHYPRSQETVVDIRFAIDDFERRYKGAIITKFPTFYSVAKKGSKVSPKSFLEFCDRNGLPYSAEYPDSRFLDPRHVDMCIKTYEPIYDYAKMKKLTLGLLRKAKVKIRLGHEVINAELRADDTKVLTIRKGKKVRKEEFDYVINVTYARYNNFCAWLNFPKKLIRLDLVEVLWVKINSPKISLAVMDGPFSNIVPTEKKDIFTLVHIKESVLRRFVPRSGLVPKDIFRSVARSRAAKILERSSKWFPFVKEAQVLRTHYVLRGVNAYREHDDSRTSDIAEHGFGCFSILGGKIINSVAIAKQMACLIV